MLDVADEEERPAQAGRLGRRLLAQHDWLKAITNRKSILLNKG